jgi:hypothetical protein
VCIVATWTFSQKGVLPANKPGFLLAGNMTDVGGMLPARRKEVTRQIASGAFLGGNKTDRKPFFLPPRVTLSACVKR